MLPRHGAHVFTYPEQSLVLTSFVVQVSGCHESKSVGEGKGKGKGDG